jgi:hypothetical protein
MGILRIENLIKIAKILPGAKVIGAEVEVQGMKWI